MLPQSNATLDAFLDFQDPACQWVLKFTAAAPHALQILGGVGTPNAEVRAAQVTRRLADLIGADAVLLPAPGVVGSKSALAVLLKDRFVCETLDRFSWVTLALVGLGTADPLPWAGGPLEKW